MPPRQPPSGFHATPRRRPAQGNARIRPAAPGTPTTAFYEVAHQGALTFSAGSGTIVCLVMAAEVAELVDALGSGSSGRKAVGVRVPPSASGCVAREAFFPGDLLSPQRRHDQAQLSLFDMHLHRRTGLLQQA
jgi:hypothetical protein